MDKKEEAQKPQKPPKSYHFSCCTFWPCCDGWEGNILEKTDNHDKTADWERTKAEKETAQRMKKERGSHSKDEGSHIKKNNEKNKISSQEEVESEKGSQVRP